MLRAKNRTNPFQTLYLTEALTDPGLYWDLFSPTILSGEANRLFREGNIVLLGSNGTGKTMLLRLFSPAVRAAVLRQTREDPIPEESRRFLSIEVNFVSAGVGRLGRRAVAVDHEVNLSLWPLILGDFLNYYLVGELMDALSFLHSDGGRPLAEFLGATVDQNRLEEFALWLASRDCWFGGLNHVESFRGLREAVEARIFAYRSFANWNTERLPERVAATKTEIAVPIIEARNGISSLEILDTSVPLMVTIDQYETLIHIDYETKGEAEDSVGKAFCRVVNTFMATRNPAVSYKVGVRPYSWGREVRALGTDARLEVGRDYQKVDLDEILRRSEDTSTWIFPQFARDVARRRMEWTFGESRRTFRWPEDSLVALTPEDEIRKYCANDDNRLLPWSKEWPSEWNELLAALYKESKFEAKLAEVWVRQEFRRRGQLPEVPLESAQYPWRREWFQKERREALLMQIASRCRQRRIYGGWNTFVTLSGYNILVFLSLCREVWDTQERTISKKRVQEEPINPETQTQAIRVVAEEWYNKQTEWPGGAQRQDFVRRLGIGILKALLADETLSNPGHNGFSLLLDEYLAPSAAKMREFLDHAADFGALLASEHTTKERDKRPRKKWYIFPMLCPNFEIPAVRTKEPYYASASEVNEWLDDSRPPIQFGRKRRQRKSPQLDDQVTLFEEN